MTTAFMQLHPGEVTRHPPLEFYAGDTWEISASCSDGDGNLIDLSTAAITWRLNKTSGANVLQLGVGTGIVLIENTSGDLIVGQCLITVTATQSGALPIDFYQDELTVMVGAKVLTQFTGRIRALAKLPGP